MLHKKSYISHISSQEKKLYLKISKKDKNNNKEKIEIKKYS